jgi:very-short-patch-repair endonuclease
MLLTEAEQVLYRRLQEALPSHIVFAQVQLLQVVRFKGRTRELSVMNRISQLSLDFLVVTSDTRVVAAIELDDSSHDRAERKASDARKTHALKSAGIPLLRWSVRKAPDAEAIRLAIASASSSE